MSVTELPFVDGLRHGVEVRADQSVDELHQPGRHSAGAVQYGSNAQVLSLRVAMVAIALQAMW